MMKIGLRVMLVLLVIAALVWLAQPRPQTQAGTSLVGLATTPEAGFKYAEGPRSFQFPLDDGPHPDYQTEWWYYTGNLVTADGRHFGYELTFFRRALQPVQDQVKRSSPWATNQVYLAHFTLSDIQTNQFHYYERYERGAAGLAGASGDPSFQVWLGTWSVSQTGAHTYHLEAEQSGVSVSLNLVDSKGPILQGIDGYSQKGSGAGNASYYISRTRLVSDGRVAAGNQTFTVTGESWMDHEFSTSALAPDLVGWDWFGLQLSDGSELMLYNLRRSDGSIDPYSSGTIIYPDGSTRHLTQGDFRVTVLAHWKSPHSGADYPSEWQVEVPSDGIRLTIQPRMADQELRVSFTYWEGAVAITGTRQGQAVQGSGYVELTGYAGSMQGQF